MRNSFLRLTIPQEKDEVLSLVEIRLNIQGSVKSLPPFVVPVSGMELFLYKQEKVNLYEPSRWCFYFVWFAITGVKTSILTSLPIIIRNTMSKVLKAWQFPHDKNVTWCEYFRSSIYSNSRVPISSRDKKKDTASQLNLCLSHLCTESLTCLCVVLGAQLLKSNATSENPYLKQRKQIMSTARKWKSIIQ